MVSLTQPLRIAARMFLPRELKDNGRISFSQCGEDLIVRFIFEAIGIGRPSYLDVGAYDPYIFSNTALFYQSGSTGINIEPNPDFFRKFLKVRKKDVNLNIGISEVEGEADFYLMSAPTLSTLSKAAAEDYAKETGHFIRSVRKIKTDRIDNVMMRYYDGRYPDFLSLDTEGSDLSILQSMDYTQSCPTVICVETLTYSENGRGRKLSELVAFLEAKGYLTYADTNINTIFVRRDRWVR